MHWNQRRLAVVENNLCILNLLGKLWKKYAFCVTLLAEATTRRNSTTVAMSGQIGESMMWLVLWANKWVMVPHVSWMRSHVCTLQILCLPTNYVYKMTVCILFVLRESVPDLVWGALVLLHGFHPSILQPCSMQAINLGVMYDVNGSCMNLDLIN